MDNFQKALLKYVDIKISVPEGASASFYAAHSNVMSLNQGKDIMLTKFSVEIKTLFVSKIIALKKGEFIELPFALTGVGEGAIQERLYSIVLDYDDRFEELTLHFDKEYAEPYVIKVHYIEADKGKYYAEIENAKRAEALKKMNVRYSTGGNLVNIYFQLISNDINKVSIELFLNEKDDDQLIGIYDVGKNMLFLSVTGLAYGDYKFRVNQYVNEKILVSSEKISFSLGRPNYSGGRTVRSDNRD